MSGDGAGGGDNGVAGKGGNLKGAVMKGRPDRVTPAGRVHLGAKGGTAGPVVTVAAATGRTRAAPVATSATRARGIRMRQTPTRRAVTAGLAMWAALEARTAWMPATAGPMGVVAVAGTAFAQVMAGKMVTAPAAAAGTTVATRVPVGMDDSGDEATGGNGGDGGSRNTEGGEGMAVMRASAARVQGGSDGASAGSAGPMGMVAMAGTAFAQVAARKMVTTPAAAAGTTMATGVLVGMEVTAVRASPVGRREWRRCARRRHDCRWERRQLCRVGGYGGDGDVSSCSTSHGGWRASKAALAQRRDAVHARLPRGMAAAGGGVALPRWHSRRGEGGHGRRPGGSGGLHGCRRPAAGGSAGESATSDVIERVAFVRLLLDGLPTQT